MTVCAPVLLDRSKCSAPVANYVVAFVIGNELGLLPYVSVDSSYESLLYLNEMTMIYIPFDGKDWMVPPVLVHDIGRCDLPYDQLH